MKVKNPFRKKKVVVQEAAQAVAEETVRPYERPPVPEPVRVPTANCGECSVGIYSAVPRECWGCEEILCFNCAKYKPIEGSITTWCESCWEIMDFNRAPKKSPKNLTASYARYSPVKHKRHGGKKRKHVPIPQRVRWANTKPYSKVKFQSIIPSKVLEFYKTPQKEDFYPLIEDEAFWKIMSSFMKNTHREIAGAAVWDESSNTIVWAGIDEEAIMSAGHVSSSIGALTVEAMLAGHGVPNVQWHTHPGFSAWFSSEDKTDQMETTERVMKLSESGYHIFIVFDRMSWRVTRIDWADGKILGLRNGYVVAHGLRLDYQRMPARKPIKQGKSSKQKLLANGKSTVTQRPSGLLVVANDDAAMPFPSLLEESDATRETAAEEYFMSKGRYVGQHSNDDNEYASLFDRMDVAVGDWPQLYKNISRVFGPNHYRSIVEHKSVWDNIPDYRTEVIHEQQQSQQ